MEKDDLLIRSKILIPYIRPNLVPRPQLHKKLAEGILLPLTLVTAPAGYGKTTLVASTLADQGKTIAWLSLEKEDNLPGHFLKYVTGALHAADSRLWNDKTSNGDWHAILTSLINDLVNLENDIVLVLDDYQVISSRPVHECTAFMLDHCPNNFHLVIATRSDPPLALARLRARGQVVELRATDLRFSEKEATHFLTKILGLNLEPGAVAILTERTEGWVSGLQLAGISLREREDTDRFISDFAGTNRFIMDFMMEEVLNREPREVQDFLLQTSLLHRLCAPLCDAVTGAQNSQKMLEMIDHANLFLVPLDEDRTWYRYQNLFADLLQARLYQSGPDKAVELLSCAARWCEENGQFFDAIAYTLEAKDFRSAGELLEKYWAAVINDGEIETVWFWLNEIPVDITRKNPLLGIIYCWMLYLMARMEEIEVHLDDVESAFMKLLEHEKAGNKDDYAVLPAEISALRAFVACQHGEYEQAVLLAEQALNQIPESSPPLPMTQLRSVMYVALAGAYDGTGDLESTAQAYIETVHLSRLIGSLTGIGILFRLVGTLRILGRLRQAEVACRDALDYVKTQGIDRLAPSGILYLTMSEVLLEQNHLDAAEVQLNRGIEIGKKSGRLDVMKNAALALSRLRLARGDKKRALEAIHQAESAFRGPLPLLARAELQAIKAKVLLLQGSIEDAAASVEEAVTLAGINRGQTWILVNLAKSRLSAARNKPEIAVVELSQSIEAAEEHGWKGALLELLILRSLVLKKQGKNQEAEADLERALTLGEAEGYIRIFLEEGQPLQALLTRWYAHGGASPLHIYARRLLSQFGAESGSTALEQPREPSMGDLVEPLSPRELEVLNHLATGETNQEIARQLVVSPGTVKAHTASIYRKLDVGNRTEAVARARTFGLLY